MKKDCPDYEKSKIDKFLENLNENNGEKKMKRAEAFNLAKRNHGIPKNQEPDDIDYDRDEHMKNYFKKKKKK